MLIPRFSIRWLLGLTTLSAGLSLVLSYAVRGEAWALGVLAGMGSLSVLAVLYAAAFAAAWMTCRGFGAIHETPPAKSPFAEPIGGQLNDPAVNDTPSITG
jgi:hypothetical protein